MNEEKGICMKERSFLLFTVLLVGALSMIGCASGTAEDIVSRVEKRDCFICGDWSGTIMEIVGKNDSVGLVYLNEPTIIDTMVRAYDDDGNELFKQETVSYRSANFGEGNGHAWITCLYDRGIADIEISFKESDAVDLKHASKTLCEDCLAVVLKSVSENSERGKKGSSGTTGFYLIDFGTRKLYAIAEPSHSRYVGEYYASFACTKEADKSTDGTIHLTVFYAPVREQR